MHTPTTSRKESVLSTTPIAGQSTQNEAHLSTTPIAGPSTVPISGQIDVAMSTPLSRGTKARFVVESSDNTDITSSSSAPEKQCITSDLEKQSSEHENQRENALLRGYMNATIPYDWTGDENEDDENDSDYDPGYGKIPLVTIGPKDVKIENLEDLGGEEVEPEAEEQPEVALKLGEDIPLPPNPLNGNIHPPNRHIGDDIKHHQMVLVSLQSQVDLAKCKIALCSKDGCEAEVTSTFEKCIGSAPYLQWVCTNGHKDYRWSGQPFVRGVRAGNLALSSAIVLSGNNVSKIKKMFKFMNVPCVGNPAFYAFQRMYICPSVKTYWETIQDEVLASCGDKMLILLEV
ncbi:unnamed protein product [Owenia fusiformis]|uniref:Uncharacterized protein n=1 Tax=Owenia fusiformis TaxID=6347 RepID=A0A8J1TBH3_OWEFU|nr:unnamed protein product [Owenia fusiformis]